MVSGEHEALIVIIMSGLGKGLTWRKRKIKAPSVSRYIVQALQMAGSTCIWLSIHVFLVFFLVFCGNYVMFLDAHCCK